MKLTASRATFAVFVAVAAFWLPASADTRDGMDALDAKQYDKAFKELLPEAKKGDVEAQYYLARMHQAGWGTAKDLKKAYAYFGQAAKLGHVPSQKEYGAALALGEGVDQDAPEGLKWLIIAAQNGHEGAAQFAGIFSKSFPRRQVAAARRAAS
ncbi:MAG: sel1 repeat family protein, partial [Rhodospirillaceae bacterium]|nr:sel1 repeat family protein [Rhodospirillaceae bacterium]